MKVEEQPSNGTTEIHGAREPDGAAGNGDVVVGGRLSVALHETFRSLSVRNFRVFFAGQTTSQIGNWLTLIAQSLLVLRITHNNGVAVGVLNAFQFGPVLLLGAWAGLVADRSDKRKLLIIVQTCAMGQSFVMAALAFTGHPPLLAIYAVAMVGGTANAFDNPARRAFVTEMVPLDHVQNAVSLNSALMTSARVIGPTLAGLLIVTVGFGWCFVVDGVSYLAVIFGLWRIRPSELRTPKPTTRGKGQIRAGLRYARSVPDLWIPLVMTAVIGTFAFNFSVVVPLFVKRTLHGTDTTFTVLYSVLSLGSLTGALRAARRTTVEVLDVAKGALFFGGAILAMSVSPTLATSFPIAILLGFGGIMFMSSCNAIVQMRSSQEMRGRVLALQAIVFLGSTPVGGPILGLICQTLGARAGFVTGGVSCLAAAAWAFSRVRTLSKPVAAAMT